MHSTIAIELLFPVILVGGVLPFLGRTRRGVLFGVTVPLDFAASPEANAAVRRYRIRTASLAVATIAAVVLLLAVSGPGNALLFSAITIELLGGMLFWQIERRAIRPHATTVPLVRSAELLPHRPLGAIYASLAALLPLAAVALWLHVHWNSIPARWPQHWNASGHVNGWGTRTSAGVYLPLLIGAFILLMMTGIAAFIALASGTQTNQRRRALAPLAAMVWVMSGIICVVGFLPVLHEISPAMTAFTVAFYLLAIATVVICLIRQGMVNSSPSAEPYDGTPDARWHAGLLYYNPTDAAVIVPKRYGFGWTLNFARPAALLFTGGLVLVVVVSTLITFWIK
jgi:uncharacterized membrane protein